jgi:hypothetical protein
VECRNEPKEGIKIIRNTHGDMVDPSPYETPTHIKWIFKNCFELDGNHDRFQI